MVMVARIKTPKDWIKFCDGINFKSCPRCGSAKTECVVFSSNPQHPHFSCDECGNQFTNPAPSPEQINEMRLSLHEIHEAHERASGAKPQFSRFGSPRVFASAEIFAALRDSYQDTANIKGGHCFGGKFS
jgi:hypothetical protein